MRGRRHVVGIAAATLAAPALLIGLGLRYRWPVVLDWLRRTSRDRINPGQMETAGRAGAYASIVEHRGRVSGKSHRTPVVVRAVDDGFVVTLTYGSRADWVRNVMAAGQATLVTEGETIESVTPRVVPLDDVEAAAWLRASERRLLRWLGIDSCLLLTPPERPLGDR